MRPGTGSSGSAARALVLVAATGLITLGGCGEDAPESDDPVATAPAGEGAITEPPSETAPAGGGTAPVREETGTRSEGDEPEDSAVAEPCPDVVIAPNSGAGLFDVQAEQITCTDAATVLRAWGEAGFPGEGPEGFACEPLVENADGSTRLRCTQGTSGGVLEFATGG